MAQKFKYTIKFKAYDLNNETSNLNSEKGWGILLIASSLLKGHMGRGWEVLKREKRKNNLTDKFN